MKSWSPPRRSSAWWGELDVQLVPAEQPDVGVAGAAAGLRRSAVRRRVVRVRRGGAARCRQQVVVAAVAGVHDLQVVVRGQNRLELEAPGRVVAVLGRDRVRRGVGGREDEVVVLVVVLRLHQVAVVERHVELDVGAHRRVGGREGRIDLPARRTHLRCSGSKRRTRPCPEPADRRECPSGRRTPRDGTEGRRSRRSLPSGRRSCGTSRPCRRTRSCRTWSRC